MFHASLRRRSSPVGSIAPRAVHPQSHPSSKRRKRLLASACTSALAVGLSTLATPPVEASYPILLGASAYVDELQGQIGVPLARHSFGKLSGNVPTGRLINMKPTVSWSTVANAQPGSAVYQDIVRWADTLNARPGVVLFTFSHEPEGESSRNLGTNTTFIAAFQRVVNVFRSRGVDNVEYTWNVTSNAFRVPPGDNRYAPKWYPGDAYVDNVATAAYNWYNCGEGKGLWLSLANRTEQALAFAKSHNKQYVLAEFASQRDPRRAQWLRDAYQWFKDNRAHVRAAFYYNTSDQRPGCYWRLTTSEEISAFRTMASDRAVFGS